MTGKLKREKNFFPIDFSLFFPSFSQWQNEKSGKTTEEKKIISEDKFMDLLYLLDLNENRINGNSSNNKRNSFFFSISNGEKRRKNQINWQ